MARKDPSTPIVNIHCTYGEYTPSNYDLNFKGQKLLCGNQLVLQLQPRRITVQLLSRYFRQEIKKGLTCFELRSSSRKQFVGQRDKDG